MMVICQHVIGTRRCGRALGADHWPQKAERHGGVVQKMDITWGRGVLNEDNGENFKLLFADNTTRTKI